MADFKTGDSVYMANPAKHWWGYRPRVRTGRVVRLCPNPVYMIVRRNGYKRDERWPVDMWEKVEGKK